MRRVLTSALFFLAVASAAWAADGDIFSDAKAGKIGCYGVRADDRTCLMMVSYKWKPNGKVEAEFMSHLGSEAIETGRSTASVEGDMICHEAPPDTAKYISGASWSPSSPPQSSPLVLIADDDTAEGQQQFCFKFMQLDKIYSVETWQNGKLVFNSFARWRWITPDENFNLAEEIGFR